MKLKIITAIVCITFITSLCACSSDKKITKLDKIEMGKNQSTQISNSQGKIVKVTNGVNIVGDTIQIATAEKGELIPNALSYTVTKASIFSSITEAGISEDKINSPEPDFLDKNGQLKASVKFVVAEITVKNLKASSDMNITDLLFVYFDSLDMSKEVDVINLLLPAYFSSSKNNSEKDYYEYNLAIGQSKNVKVGWYLDTEKYKESNVYLAFSLYQDENRRFVKLGL